MDRIEAIDPPPYTITPAILACIERIGEAIGSAQATGAARDLTLRRINRIRTIRGSLAIEGNILSEERIATILDGKHVAGPPRDLQEVRNAIAAYDRYPQWDPANERDLLVAHEILMAGLLRAPGRYRSGPVAVMGRGGSRASRSARSARTATHGQPAGLGRDDE